MKGLLKKDNYRVSLYCFSPPVMIATFIIEMILAIYTFIKSMKHKSDVGLVIVLIFLAIFQLSEYQICEGSSLLLWARIGLFAITFLPVLGYYLITKINKGSYFAKISFLIAIAFTTYFILIPESITEVTCSGNYVIIDLNTNLNGLYGYYYFGFLFLGIYEAIKGINNKKVKDVMKWFIIGYLSFILPLTLVYILIPTSRVAVASIMCGFAVIFAFILTFKIAPIYHECIKK